MSISAKPGSRRRYLAGAMVSALAAGTSSLPLARAATSFGSEPLVQDRVIALAQPLSGDRWNLILLEQREPGPPCWRRNANGSVLTYEMHLPEATCGRYLSSSAYSLRVGGEDLRHPWRLRVDNNNGQLQLLASGSQQSEPLLIGSGRAAGSALVELELHNNWTFARRSFEGQALSHLYVAHENPLPVLLAQARSGSQLLAAPPAPPPPPADARRPATVASLPRSSSSATTSRARQAANQAQAPSSASSPASSSSSSRLARLESLRFGQPRTAALDSSGPDQGSGVVALQVVPYRP